MSRDVSRGECLPDGHLVAFLGRYFDEISQDTGKYCFGVDDTLKALELGAVEILICWENLDIQRYVLKNHSTGEEEILHLTPEQEKDKTHFNDKDVSGKTMISAFCFLLVTNFHICSSVFSLVRSWS